MKINNTFKLIISLIIPQLAGGLGSYFTIGSVKDWYPVLVKPALNPPAWIFGPVWTTLFLLMGYALYLVWSSYADASADKKDESGKSKRLAYWVFGIQMVLNALWSIIFFGLQSPGGALFEIVFLWLAILATIIAFYKISKPAAWLLLPYILWVSFAGYLNYSIWQLNSAGSGQVACTQEAKLCPDGSYVGRVASDCNFALCPKEDLIQVEKPQANDTIASPLVIKGMARGFWFFEASFPIKLYNENGELLATAIAQANPPAGGDWMTEEFVPFTAELKFENPKTEKGTLVLEKDNPSGLPENADELRMPVLFTKVTKQIKLYYYNPELDKDESGNVMCSRDGLVSVDREVTITKTPIQDAIKLLLKGQITEQEKSQGISTEYPLNGFSLKGASLKDSVLTLEFEDLNNKSIGGSCRVGILWFQIEATAKQFTGVKQVRFLPEDIFQP